MSTWGGSLSRRRTTAALGCLLTMAAACVVGTADASPAKSGGEAVHGPAALSFAVSGGVDAQQKALAAYWSSDRIKAALPADTLLKDQKDTAAPATSTGPAGKVAPSAPKVAPTASGVQPQAYDPGYPVGSPVARTYGKVFFTNNGLDYVCSGTVVNTEAKSEVWTAGHCVHDAGQWNTNWVFVPNYVNGFAPYGYWYAYQLWSVNGWINDSDNSDDVGAAVMYRNDNWRIADYLGGQGIAWNYSDNYDAYAFGYPQASPFNGCCLVAEHNTATVLPIFGFAVMANSMTGGSSGGGWLRSFDGNWGYINGHNDYKYDNQPSLMYSPYYGDQVGNLFNAVRNIST
jgi:hypothetical protein